MKHTAIEFQHRTPSIMMLAMLTTFVATTSASATSYKFTVTCQAATQVIEWKTGAIDPGREALRVSTGSNFPDCSVSDFNPTTDANLPVQVNEGAVAVVQGVPLVGEVAKEVPLIGDALKGLGGAIDSLF